MSYQSRPVIDRILEKVVRNENNCWIFIGHQTEFGYGTIKVGGKFGKPQQAHREVYKHFKGEIPLGLFVCHTCDNPPCCNPDHLFLGTHQDNMNDMKLKNRRHKPPYGEKSYYHKFSSEIINKIRLDDRPYIEISQEYHTSKSNISYIKNNKSRIKG